MPENLKAVFFDFDGTLADSVGVLRDVYMGFLAFFDKEGSQQEFDSLNGPPLTEVIVRLKKTHDLPGDAEHLLKHYEDMVSNHYAQAGVMPGVSDVFSLAREKSMKIGIVTSGLSVWVEDWSKRNDFGDYVDFIVDRNSVMQGKPSPDPYNEALQLAGCEISESCAVEDSLTGAKSATAAGLTTYIVGRPDDKTDWPENVIYVSDLAQLSESWKGS